LRKRPVEGWQDRREARLPRRNKKARRPSDAGLPAIPVLIKLLKEVGKKEGMGDDPMPSL